MSNFFLNFGDIEKKQETPLKEIVGDTYESIVEALKALKEVKDACFGPNLKPNWKASLDNFEKAWYEIYIEFDISFSNKCHVIIEHIPQVIQRTGKSLYLSSEQVVEATHAKFDKFWQRYKVLALEKESHGNQLLKCVIDFNSKNI